MRDAYNFQPHFLQVSKERPSSSASLLSHSACKAPQSVSYSTPLQAPTRCRSVAPSNPSVDPSRPHHVRSESLDRGKSNLREEKRVLKTEASASIKTEKSPEKVSHVYSAIIEVNL